MKEKILYRKIYFWMKQINRDDNFFLVKNFFQKFSLTKRIFLYLFLFPPKNKFSYPKFFDKIFLTNIFLTKQIFWPQNYFAPNFFGQIFIYYKYFLTIIFYPKFYWTNKGRFQKKYRKFPIRRWPYPLPSYWNKNEKWFTHH